VKKTGNMSSPPTPEDINTAAGGRSQDGDGIVEFPEDEDGERNTQAEKQDHAKLIKK
jgi:hypothetical protein